MEYERIHKVQTGNGMISPSKLRIKLLGPHRKKDGSNSNSSSRTSPSKLVDSEFGNCLLASKSSDHEVAGLSFEVPSTEQSIDAVVEEKPGCRPNKEQLLIRQNSGKTRLQITSSKTDGGVNMNLSAIHPMRMLEDENLDYDSNASSSSFEFDKGERSVQSALSRSHSHSRHVPSKWNDAEKWIVSRPGLHNNAGRLDRSLSVKSTTVIGKFPDLKDSAACVKSLEEDRKGTVAIRSVCMRDMGTEMTPIASLEPSRTATPAGATTPLRSPPSTPRGVEASNKELSEEEMKLEARKEIVALGIQLGKMSIAAWASKDGLEKSRSLSEAKTTSMEEEFGRVENERLAASWEEAENTRHMTRFKREEIKIHVWESRRKAKLDAELRKIEAQVEEMRARARAKAVKRVAMARQRCEEKRAAAEARESREAERIAAGAEYIRETGRFPPSNYICCGWLS